MSDTRPPGKNAERKKRPSRASGSKPRGGTGGRPAAKNERLALSKQQILDFCDSVLAKWEADPAKDSRYIFAMNAVKTSILWTEEDTIREIWSEIIYWVFELMYKNAIAQGDDENLEWSEIMGRLKDSL